MGVLSDASEMLVAQFDREEELGRCYLVNASVSVGLIIFEWMVAREMICAKK